MTRSVVGRVGALRAVDALLDVGPTGPTALVLDGEAGIGKTTVWLAAIERARGRGSRVLSCRPAEAAVAAPFASLGDLLNGIPGAQLDSLAEGRRAALEAALGRVAPSERVEHLAVARAVVELVRGLTSSEHVLLAVDDVQWLDAATASVLEFALRRLSDSPTRLLVARRTDREELPPLGLAQAMPAERLVRVRLGPLSATDLDRVLRAVLDVALLRPRLLELHRISGGNPFYALEIVRRGLPADGAEPLAVPAEVGELVEARLAALSGRAREAALLAVAASHPTSALIERAAGSDALEEALHEGVLEVEGGRLRPAHPLLASILYGRAEPSERRAAHDRLAAVVEDPEEHARHLALSTDEPDEAVAAKLEDAAALAARRGAPGAAALLTEHSVRLTPVDLAETARRRMRAAADQHYSAGNQERSGSLLTTLVNEGPAGPERARAFAQLSQSVASQLECLELCRRGLEEAGADAALRSDLHLMAAASARRAATLAEAAEHARSAEACAADAADDARRARALAMLGHVETLRGDDGGMHTLERAVALEATVPSHVLHFRPGFLFGITLLYVGELERSRPLLEGQLELADERGEEVMRGVALSTLAELELRAGNWTEAQRFAEGGASLQEQAAPLQDQAHHVLRAARVAAHVGRIEEARSTAVRLLELASRHGDRMAEVSARRDLGFIELSLGNPADAVGVLEPALRLFSEMGFGLYSVQPFLPDLVEALVAIDELERAEAANAVLDRERSWETAMYGRGRALIAAAQGDRAAATAAIAHSLEAHERLQWPFELGRTLLVQGSLELAARRRGTARDALTRALELFERLGAPFWATKARAELARIPGRVPGSGELTETERRVAELVASGLSNKEVAARLFVTVRTVESNLSRVYAKLGIHTRTELPGRLHVRP